MRTFTVMPPDNERLFGAGDFADHPLNPVSSAWILLDLYRLHLVWSYRDSLHVHALARLEVIYRGRLVRAVLYHRLSRTDCYAGDDNGALPASTVSIFPLISTAAAPPAMKRNKEIEVIKVFMHHPPNGIPIIIPRSPVMANSKRIDSIHIRLHSVKSCAILCHEAFRSGGRDERRVSMSDRPITAGNGNFKAEVMESDLPVLVDFWAPWCGYCTAIAPVVDAIAADYAGKLKVCKVNIDEAPDIASRYGIMSIPTLALFINGKEADKMVGAISRQKIEEKIKPHL
jgi:thioredoxin 1